MEIDFTVGQWKRHENALKKWLLTLDHFTELCQVCFLFPVKQFIHYRNTAHVNRWNTVICVLCAESPLGRSPFSQASSLLLSSTCSRAACSLWGRMESSSSSCGGKDTDENLVNTLRWNNKLRSHNIWQSHYMYNWAEGWLHVAKDGFSVSFP